MRILIPCLLLTIATPSFRASSVDGSVANPPIPAVRFTAPPTIDGTPDEDCWKDAPVVTGFTHDTGPASVDTEVRMGYDDRAMYFAFVCHDPQPGSIRSGQRKRNGNMSTDDTVSVGIDPKFDKTGAYWFITNPVGTQAEDIPGGSASKVEWRGDWSAASKVTAEGWTAEMAIPFAILRYPRGQRVFGLMFARHLSRLLEGSNWPVKTFYYVHDNEARWDGLDAPRIQRKPLVMPYVLAAGGTIKSSAGVDLKYTAENNTTSLITIRPDFATIEDVVKTVDFSYNPQYLDDRRPFFTEGGDMFGSHFGFYSRSIGQVDVGAKSFGKVGNTGYGILGTERRNDERDGMLTTEYSFNQFSSLWFQAVGFHKEAYLTGNDNRMPQTESGLATVDNGVFRIGGHYWHPLAVNGLSTQFDYYSTRTTGDTREGDPFRYSGNAVRASFDRYTGDGLFESHGLYEQVSPDFDGKLAYIPEVGYRRAHTEMGESWQVKRGPLLRWSAYLWANHTMYWDGGSWHSEGSPSVGAQFRNDTMVNLGFDWGNRHDASTRQEAASAPFYRDRIVNLNLGWKQSDIYKRGSLFGRSGRQAGGPYHLLAFSQGFRVTEKLSGSAEIVRVRLSGTLVRLNTTRAILNGLYEFSDERSLAVRCILGNQKYSSRGTASDDFSPYDSSLRNAFIAYRQELRKGADIFVLVGDPNTVGVRSQVAVKYVRTL
ncbi:MAG TPA: DUF5916 domain-containing protein [Armatimonadota bacterium]